MFGLFRIALSKRRGEKKCKKQVLTGGLKFVLNSKKDNFVFLRLIASLTDDSLDFRQFSFLHVSIRVLRATNGYDGDEQNRAKDNREQLS